MKKLLETHLNKREMVELLSLSHDTLRCNERESLTYLVLSLKKLFFFDVASCAYSNMVEGLLKPDPDIDLCNISHPQEYLDLYVRNNFHLVDSIFPELLESHRPVNRGEVDKRVGTNNIAATLAYEFDIRDGWAHGVVYPDSMDCSYFFFGGHYADNNVRSSMIISYIIPFLAEAYKRILKKAAPQGVGLTPREIEILNWLKEGKSSWDISVILSCSKRTVEFHVTNIKKKFNAVNRVQAVAVALHHGVIGF